MDIISRPNFDPNFVRVRAAFAVQAEFTHQLPARQRPSRETRAAAAAAEGVTRRSVHLQVCARLLGLAVDGRSVAIMDSTKRVAVA